MRGVSPIISAVLLIVITLGIAATVSPWVFDLAADTITQTGQDSTTQLTCRNAAYDFDTNFASSGLNWSLDGENETLEAMMINTGNVNIYNFSFEIEVVGESGRGITYLDVSSASQRTAANPLKPGQTALLKALIFNPVNATLNSVRVLNDVCPNAAPSQDV